ncbi:uncharacterized protein LOC120846302 [Ixodes scapularis]|uniref:uncharacterized protein LOC120846302 n=1 Tax=Ixodes scapularis TaxID=6945 RepID=UPI001A9ED719|nr:uncharacterized protein LOC120846302 [Ixodes scapularis]
MTWFVQTAKRALQMKFASGTTGYELLRTLGYPLPSATTLLRRMQSFYSLPGILGEVFDILKRKAYAMEEAERDCVFFLDEIEIEPGIADDQAEDCFLGSMILPKKNDDANRALVFMLGGLTSRWKQVIAYHFT